MSIFVYLWPVILLFFAGLGAAAFRKSIITWATKAVEHQFNIDLENVRAELHRRETQINALAGNVLSGRLSRETALQQRRMLAAERLWAQVVDLGRFRGAVMMLSVINVSKAAPLAGRDARARQMFKSMAQGIDLNTLPSGDAADKERPYLTDTAWAYFYAHRVIIFSAVFQLKLLEMGANPQEVMDTAGVGKLIKAALPSYADYVDQYGAAGFPHLIEPLETLLLTELRRIIEGKQLDHESLANAAAIIQISQNVMSETVKAATDAGMSMV